MLSIGASDVTQIKRMSVWQERSWKNGAFQAALRRDIRSTTSSSRCNFHEVKSISLRIIEEKLITVVSAATLYLNRNEKKRHGPKLANRWHSRVSCDTSCGLFYYVTDCVFKR